MLESEDDSRRNGVTAEKTLLTAEDLEALSAAAVDGTTKDIWSTPGRRAVRVECGLVASWLPPGEVDYCLTG